jgi:hypothetical protein
MREIAAALARRRSGHMAADASGRLDELAVTLTGRTLAELTRRRRDLSRVLQGAPPPVDHVIEETSRVIEALLARRNAWRDGIEAASSRGEAPDSSRADWTIAQLDRAVDRQEARLAAAQRQGCARRDWLADHADTVAEIDLVRRAERAREVQVAARAVHDVPPALAAIIGPEPARQRDRHAWRMAVEATAIYCERYGVSTCGGRGPDAVLGERPGDAVQAGDRAATIAAIAAAAAATTRQVGVGVEL